MSTLSRIKTSTSGIANKYPLVIAICLLLLLLILITIGSLLRRPDGADEALEAKPKEVVTYAIGETPRIRIRAVIEKSGVITINALSGGVVSSLPVTTGSKVRRGALIASLASNYSGANASSLQRQLAQKQLQLTQDSYETQKDLISIQRDIAEKSFNSSLDLRDIQSKSIDATKSIVSQNNSLISSLESNITSLEAMNADGSQTAAIQALKGQKIQLSSANLQLESGLRSAEYATNADQEPSQLNALSKDITLKQLDVQMKSLDIGREIAKIQLSLAYISESLSYPRAPFAATVEKVFVKLGESVAPGTPLVLLSQVKEDDPVTAIAYVSEDIARSVNRGELVTLFIPAAEPLAVMPNYITTEAVQGQLYAIYLPIPDAYAGKVGEGSSIDAELPVGAAETSIAVPYIPLSAVKQTQVGSFVSIASENNVVINKAVETGVVVGRLVEITSGLDSGDRIILDSTVVAGQIITPSREASPSGKIKQK